MITMQLPARAENPPVTSERDLRKRKKETTGKGPQRDKRNQMMMRRNKCLFARRWQAQYKLRETGLLG